MALDPEFKAYFEHVDSRFDKVVEVITATREKLDATFEAVGELQEDVTTLKEDMMEVKSRLDLIRSELKAKADRSELQLLEQRVSRLERLAAHA